MNLVSDMVDLSRRVGHVTSVGYDTSLTYRDTETDNISLKVS